MIHGETPMKRFMIYFFETEDQQFVKIGHCQGNLYVRKLGIQTGCPIPLGELLGIILCKNKDEMLKVENQLKKRFKEYKTRGEWFLRVAEIDTYIQEFTESGQDVLEEDQQKNLDSQRERERERIKDPEYRKQRRKTQREHDRERRKDLEYRERQHEYNRERRKNPEYRESDRERARERYQNNTKIRENQLKNKRDRYQNDPEVRERAREYQRERAKDPEYRERESDRRKDPKYRERKREYMRKYRKAKNRERQQISGQQLMLQGVDDNE